MLVALLLAALAWRPAGVAAGGGSCVQLQRSEPRYDQDNWETYQAQLRDEVASVDTGPVCTLGSGYTRSFCRLGQRDGVISAQ